MSRRQHPSPTLVALLALFTLTGAACSGSLRGRAPYLQHAAITPIQISSPASVPAAEPQAPRPVEDPVLTLIADSDRHFKAGQKELDQGLFELLVEGSVEKVRVSWKQVALDLREETLDWSETHALEF